MACKAKNLHLPVSPHRWVAIAALSVLSLLLLWCDAQAAGRRSAAAEFQRCMRLGVSQAQRGQRRAAKDNFEKCARLRPKDPAARGWFGRSLVECVQFDTSYQTPAVARATLQQALDEFVAVLSLSDQKANVARAAFYIRVIAGLLPRHATEGAPRSSTSTVPQTLSRLDLTVELADAVIELTSTDGTFYSRAGALALNGLAPGPYELTVKRSERKTISRTIVLGAGETRREHLRLGKQTK